MAEEVKPATPTPQAAKAEPVKEENQHELEAEILAHQIDGIMFHIDAVLLYKLIGMPKMARMQMRRVHEESDNNLMTACKLIEKYGEIVDPANVSRETDISELKYAPIATHTDRAVINQKIIKAWKAWEEETRDIYADAVREQPECAMWHKMHREVEKELKLVEYMWKKYMTAEAK